MLEENWRQWMLLKKEKEDKKLNSWRSSTDQKQDQNKNQSKARKTKIIHFSPFAHSLK